jgi:hypothetical protein
MVCWKPGYVTDDYTSETGISYVGDSDPYISTVSFESGHRAVYGTVKKYNEILFKAEGPDFCAVKIEIEEFIRNEFKFNLA